LGGAGDIGSLCDDVIKPFVQPIAADDMFAELFELRIHPLSRQSRRDAPREIEVSDDVVDGIAASVAPEAICGNLFDFSVAYLSEYRAGCRRHNALPESVLENMCGLVAPESVLPQFFRFPIDSLAELRSKGSSPRLPEEGAPIEVPEDIVTRTGDEVATEQLPRDLRDFGAEGASEGDLTSDGLPPVEEMPDGLITETVARLVSPQSILDHLFDFPIESLSAFTIAHPRPRQRSAEEENPPGSSDSEKEVSDSLVDGAVEVVSPMDIISDLSVSPIAALDRHQTRRPAEAPRQADATGESRDKSEEEEEAADPEIPDDLARRVGEAVPLWAVLGDLFRLPVNGLRSFTPGKVARPIPVKTVDKEPGSGHSEDNPEAPGREDGEDCSLQVASSPPPDDNETSTEDDLPEIPDELTQMPSLAVEPADVLPTCFDLPVKPLLRYELRHRPPQTPEPD
jgi:hypothetical protein